MKCTAIEEYRALINDHNLEARRYILCPCRRGLVKEMDCDLSNIQRFRERPGQGDGPRSVEGRANNLMSLRSLDGQLCLPGRVPLQTFHLSFDNEPSSSLPLCILLPGVFRQ